MGTDKRERKKANRAARIAAEQAAAARQRRLRTMRNLAITVVVVVLVMVLISVLSGCGTSGGGTASSSDATTASDTGTGSGGDKASSSDTTTASDEGSDTSTTEGCPPADGVDEPVIDFDEAPPTCIDPAKTYTATVVTTKGTVVVRLDTDRTPITTNNFVVLARFGYYDDTSLFRTEAASGIIQGGSPHTQDNTDPGPGYTIPDEGLPFSSGDYGPGTLAMARTAAPDSAGGQFFFLANDGGRYLGDPAQLGSSAGSYAVFGKVTKGLDVLQEIAALDDGSSAPSEDVRIEKVTISES
jgi:cyclophilin family peptidyl-prolyl cis-trans isomerase